MSMAGGRAVSEEPLVPSDYGGRHIAMRIHEIVACSPAQREDNGHDDKIKVHVLVNAPLRSTLLHSLRQPLPHLRLWKPCWLEDPC